MKPHTICRKHTLTREMKQIAKSYSEALTFLNTHFSPFDTEQNADECERYVQKVKNAYLKLDGLEQRFIDNEFFSNDDPSPILHCLGVSMASNRLHLTYRCFEILIEWN